MAAALEEPGPAFIFECKAASPSAGVLIADYDPGVLAAEYDGVADAISVLTEPEFFGGALPHLARVREQTDVPLLRKDFMLAPEEVVEARAWGADAVLLMLSVLDDNGWVACHEAARNLGMDVLTEVHNEGELERALLLEAHIIGINNRDLKTLDVDLSVTERLAPRIPSGRRVISESGIASRADVARLAPLVDGFLVGTRLSRGGYPGRTARELAFGQFKVCGLTRPEDARVAWRAGAVMGGLIFAPGSPRLVDAQTARSIRASAPLAWVGVFQDQPLPEVAAMAEQLELAAVQLHGREDASYGRALRSVLSPACEIWKAVRGRPPLPDPRDLGADRLLLDTGPAGQLGGSGIPFDAKAMEGIDLSASVLAGGISPANAAVAAGFSPWLIDLNSGVESAPGKKDAARIRAVAAVLREAVGCRGGTRHVR